MEFSVGSVPGRTARKSARVRAPQSTRPTIRSRLLSDVFDVFPVGVLIVSGDRRLITWNPAAVETLGGGLESAGRCCDVLGCRTPGGPLEDVCLTELALARGRRIDGLVTQVPGDPSRTMSIAATPFSRAGGRTVLFVLQATEAAPTGKPARRPETLRIVTLGETVVESDGGEIHDGWLDQRTGRLLKFLVAHRYTPMHADAIAEALWPRARADTTNTVRHFIHALREKLEPDRGRYERSAFVLARNGGYQLNPERVTVDADAFESEAKAGLIAYAASDGDKAVEHFKKALELYRGDFLPAERYDDWALAERERLRELAAKPLRILAQLAADPEEAAAYLERLAEMEPLDVELQRELIGAWLRQGRRGRALRHYRALQSRLMRELGELVTFDLTELARTDSGA